MADIIQMEGKRKIWPKSKKEAVKELIDKEEAAAKVEFEKLMQKFGEEFNVQVLPKMIFEFSPSGVRPIAQNFNIVSNRRFQK